MEVAGIPISPFDPCAYISAEAIAAPIATHIPYSVHGTYLVINGPSWFYRSCRTQMHLRLAPAGTPPAQCTESSVSAGVHARLCRLIANTQAMRLFRASPQPAPLPAALSNPHGGRQGDSVSCSVCDEWYAGYTLLSPFTFAKEPHHQPQFLLCRTDALCQPRARRLTPCRRHSAKCGVPTRYVTLAPNRLHPGSASSPSSHQWVMGQTVYRIGYCVLFLADDGFAPAAVRGVTGRPIRVTLHGC